MRTKSMVVIATAAGASAALAGLAAMAPQPGADRPTADARAPEIVAIVERADWCQHCLTMEPRIKEARETLADQPILFLTADYSTDATAAQAEYLLATLDAQQVWADYGKQTGLVVLIDPDTRSVVGTITHDMDADQMVETIRQAAGL